MLMGLVFAGCSNETNDAPESKGSVIKVTVNTDESRTQYVDGVTGLSAAWTIGDQIRLVGENQNLLFTCYDNKTGSDIPNNTGYFKCPEEITGNEYVVYYPAEELSYEQKCARIQKQASLSLESIKDRDYMTGWYMDETAMLQHDFAIVAVDLGAITGFEQLNKITVTTTYKLTQNSEPIVRSYVCDNFNPAECENGFAYMMIEPMPPSTRSAYYCKVETQCCKKSGEEFICQSNSREKYYSMIMAGQILYMNSK